MFGGIFSACSVSAPHSPRLPFFVLRQLHGSKVEVGVVVAAISVAAVVTRPVAAGWPTGTATSC